MDGENVQQQKQCSDIKLMYLTIAADVSASRGPGVFAGGGGGGQIEIIKEGMVYAFIVVIDSYPVDSQATWKPMT